MSEKEHLDVTKNILDLIGAQLDGSAHLREALIFSLTSTAELARMVETLNQRIAALENLHPSVLR